MPSIDHHDTIAAISTPPGVGGISVVRISGKHALKIALKGLQLDALKVRYAHFTKVSDPKTGTIIDDVVAIYFKGPASYTGDDTVEISCHGGYAAAPAILELYYRLGARPAMPGEFTRRAFLNGKLDLLQAEAVADLIHAVSDTGKKLATRTLEGKLSEKVREMRSELVDIASILELELDFSEQEIITLDRARVLEKILTAKSHLEKLRDTFSAGKILRDGASVPIAGRPNAGKSSLLNALLDEERAIISHIPGTTRDTIEERFIHDGIVFRLIDTAGLRETDDPVEKMGADRAKRTLKDADVILLVVDPGVKDGFAFERDFLAEHVDIPVIVVCNKSDIYKENPDIGLPCSLSVSALTHHHVGELVAMMTDLVRRHFQIGGETVAITKHRHKQALSIAISAIDRAAGALNDNLSNEFIALDIREAITSLDDITGHTTSEDVLNHIFDHFCIGK